MDINISSLDSIHLSLQLAAVGEEQLNVNSLGIAVVAEKGDEVLEACNEIRRAMHRENLVDFGDLFVINLVDHSLHCLRVRSGISFLLLCQLLLLDDKLLGETADFLLVGILIIRDATLVLLPFSLLLHNSFGHTTNSTIRGLRSDVILSLPFHRFEHLLLSEVTLFFDVVHDLIFAHSLEELSGV